jgi:small subunit ribosomal protein S16
VATKIRLMRLGKIRAPYYRIVVADSRTKRDGRSIETIGKYHPKENPSLIEVDAERVAYWLSVGAQPTEPVKAILSKTGDWQKHKGEPAPEPLLTRSARPDRKAVFEEAAREAAGLKADEQPRKKAERKPAAAKAADETPAGETPAAETPAAETPAAETPAAETPAAEAPAEQPAAETPAEPAGDSSASE